MNLTFLLSHLLLQGNLFAKCNNTRGANVEKIRAALTDQMAAQAKPTDKHKKLSDGGGLHLLIHPSGAKYWHISYRFAGKQNTLSLGVYPDVSLADARERRDDVRKLLADGINPSDVQRIRKAAQRAELQAQKEAQIADEGRLIAATRFMLDNEGALSFRFGNHHIALTSAETIELRIFLDTTRTVTAKVTSCH